jgi:hypothetical protein
MPTHTLFYSWQSDFTDAAALQGFWRYWTGTSRK